MPSSILSRYLLREHLGPFCSSLSVITMIFLLDLLFRSLNRILSKGLYWTVVLEFLGLNLAWIVATAVPMAVLTATLMAFGRLAADNEITALQASGIRPIRQIAPLFGAAALLVAFLLWFNDTILPECNFRVRTLATEIMRTKPSIRIEPGIWFNEIPNYGLLAQALEDSAGVTQARELLIDDNSHAEMRRTISARRGLIQSNSAEGALLLTLFQGEMQEINLAKPAEFRRIAFSKHIMTIGAKELASPTSEAEARNDREKSTIEMWSEVETIRHEILLCTQRLNLGLTNKSGLERAQAELLAEKQQLEFEAQALLVEIYKKYAIPCACFVFILIGAPLGTLARSGGIAMSGGLSLGFFLFYWACLIGGEALADRQFLSPFFAMWSANFVTGILGMFVFRSVANGNLAAPSLRLRVLLPALFVGKKARPIPSRESIASTSRHQHEPQSMQTKNEPEVLEFDVVEPDFVLRETKATSTLAPRAHPALNLSKAQRIAEILQEFVGRAQLEFVLLSDRNGVVLAQGSYQSSHPVTPPINFNQLASLAVTQMAIVQVLGKALDEEGEFTCVFQEGERHNLFIYEVNAKLILTILVERKVAVGLVRIHANEAVSSLKKILTILPATHV